jgi:D-alanyl-D-alanine carboxypeptidase (penicillin-binding protein 5/6)
MPGSRERATLVREMTPHGAHTRRHKPESDERLRAIGAQAPPLRAEALRSIAHERAGRAMRYLPVAVVVVVIVAVVVVAGVQWFRPLPAPVFRSAVSATLQVPGAPPALPWPATGAAVLSVGGVGMLGHVGSTQPVPVAGLAKVMTAYVVLADHPLAPEDDGPPVPVTAAAIATYQAEKADQQSVVPVAAGETLTERQALEGLLVASGNDMASLLAEWDAGSTASFVTR